MNDTPDGPPVEPQEPYIPAEVNLAEITVKAIILGIVLSVLLAGIPAAVISMAVLRMFRRSNILENNIVQTAASAGESLESLAAGVIFTLPALILLGTWTDFNYLETTIIAGLGGMLGVMFTIPLRRALIVESPLTYPEGVATAEVLKVGDQGGAGIGAIVAGAVVGALFKFGETGLRLWAGVIEGGRQVGGTIAYAGTNAAPALVAVGYIVGINIAMLVFLGGALNWFGAIPLVAANHPWPVHAEHPSTYTIEFQTVTAAMSEPEASAARAFNEAQRQRIGLGRDAPIRAPWETFMVEFAVVDEEMSDDQRQAAEAFNQRQQQGLGRQADSPCIPPWGLFVVEFAVTEDGISDDERVEAEAFNAAQRARVGAGADAVGVWEGPVFLIEFAVMSAGFSDEARAAAESFNDAQAEMIEEQESAFWAPAFETFLVELAVVDDRMAADVRAGAEAFNAAQMERLADQQTALWRPDGDTFRIDFLELPPDLDEDARLVAESFNADQAGAIDGQLSSYWEPVWDEFLLDFTAISARLTAAEIQEAKTHNVMVRNTLGHEVEAAEWANRIWSKRTRFIGVGAMVIGGLWALLRLWKSLVRGIASGLAAYRALHDEDAPMKRTDRDTPMQWVGIMLVLSVIPLFFVFNHVTGDVGTSVFMAVAMLIAGFLFSAVASYMAGLVGSSNNPISGVTIATLLTSALLLLALGTDTATGPAAAILIGAVVCCAAAIGGDNMQDLKSGRIVGATPYKQQIMQAVGVIAAALVMAPVLSALLRAYGIGEITVAGQEPLEAPQASLMQSVAVGVFEQNLPWTLVWTGMVVAAAIIILDLVLEARGARFRTPVLAVAVGIYLPLELSVPILFGGLISLAAHRYHVRRSSPAEVKDTAARNGLLLAAGLITGEAMLGILLAIPLAIWEGENRIADTFGDWTGLEEPLWWPGLIMLGFVLAVLYRVARGAVR
ncbi:MAG: OPT family oligopeptide transporter [Planctomycetota bacterium]|jgi:uncharacterized oligopeptide transporter (OPT) family protein